MSRPDGTTKVTDQTASSIPSTWPGRPSSAARWPHEDSRPPPARGGRPEQKRSGGAAAGLRRRLRRRPPSDTIRPRHHRRRRKRAQRCRTATSWPLGLLGRASSGESAQRPFHGPGRATGDLPTPGRRGGDSVQSSLLIQGRPRSPGLRPGDRPRLASKLRWAAFEGLRTSPAEKRGRHRLRRTSANCPDSNFGSARQHFLYSFKGHESDRRAYSFNPLPASHITKSPAIQLTTTMESTISIDLPTICGRLAMISSATTAVAHRTFHSIAAQITSGPNHLFCSIIHFMPTPN